MPPKRSRSSSRLSRIQPRAAPPPPPPVVAASSGSRKQRSSVVHAQDSAPAPLPQPWSSRHEDWIRAKNIQVPDEAELRVLVASYFLNVADFAPASDGFRRRVLAALAVLHLHEAQAPDSEWNNDVLLEDAALALQLPVGLPGSRPAQFRNFLNAMKSFYPGSASTNAGAAPVIVQPSPVAAVSNLSSSIAPGAVISNLSSQPPSLVSFPVEISLPAGVSNPRLSGRSTDMMHQLSTVTSDDLRKFLPSPIVDMLCISDSFDRPLVKDQMRSIFGKSKHAFAFNLPLNFYALKHDVAVWGQILGLATRFLPPHANMPLELEAFYSRASTAFRTLETALQVPGALPEHQAEACIKIVRTMGEHRVTLTAKYIANAPKPLPECADLVLNAFKAMNYETDLFFQAFKATLFLALEDVPTERQSEFTARLYVDFFTQLHAALNGLPETSLVDKYLSQRPVSGSVTAFSATPRPRGPASQGPRAAIAYLPSPPTPAFSGRQKASADDATPQQPLQLMPPSALDGSKPPIEDNTLYSPISKSILGRAAPVDAMARKIECYECRELGHFAFECPLRYFRVLGEPAPGFDASGRVLRNTFSAAQDLDPRISHQWGLYIRKHRLQSRPQLPARQPPRGPGNTASAGPWPALPPP